MNIEEENRRIYGSLYDSLEREGYFSAEQEKRREIWQSVINEAKREVV